MSTSIRGKREWTQRLSVEKTKFNDTRLGRMLEEEFARAVKQRDFESVANIMNTNGLVDQVNNNDPVGLTETTYTLKRGKEVRKTTSSAAADTMAKNGWDIDDVEDNII